MAPDLGCTCGWRPAPGELWPTEGGRACWWIQRYCVCGEGDWYGKPIVLRDDQVLSLYRWYEYCGGCGRWRYSHWIRTEATGGGKTTFMAAVMALELAGPPEISPVSPIITSAANSWDQANKLFGAASIMCGGREGHKVDESPLKGYFEVYDSKIIRADGKPGEINRVAAVAGTNEGGLPSLFVVDEVHELGDVGENRVRMHVVIGKSTNKRQLRCEIPVKDPDGKVTGVRTVKRGPGRIVDISTAGFDIDHSFFGGLYKHGKEALRNPAAAPRLLFECWEAPDGLKFTKAADRLAAVLAASPAAGILWDPMDRVNEWDDPKMPHTDWGRYYGNRWEKIPEDSWLKEHPGKWEACQGTWEITGDEPTVLAIDMALKRDSVSVGECAQLADGRTAYTTRIWYPEDRKIDHLEVWKYIGERITELGPRFRGLVYDPRYFEIPARMLEEEGILVIEFDQGPANMSPAVGLAFDAIINEQIVHDGELEMSRQVLAAAKREQDRGFTLSKGKSKIHIDAAITLCMGVDALARLTEEVDIMNTIW
jgi:hypothetical protein